MDSKSIKATMNLYRLYVELKSGERYLERKKLTLKLDGRRFFSEEDLNMILSYKKMPYSANANTESLTKKSFSADELGEKIRFLKRLRGVGFATATSILAFQDTNSYAEINQKVWNQLVRKYGLKGQEKDHRQDFTIEEYARYLESLNHLAKEYGMKCADVEYVLENTD